MPNIFAGLFNQSSGGGAAGKLAKYKQELEDYQTEKDAYEQAEAVRNIQPYLEKVMADMDPQRRRHVELQIEQMKNEPLFDQGSQGLNRSIADKGGTIAYFLEQEKLTEEANARHAYKVKHPTADSVNKDIETFEMYRQLSDVDKQVFRDSKRNRQVVDLKDRYRDVITGDEIMMNIIQAGVDSAQAPIISGQLNSFYDDVDATEDFLVTFENQRKDIQKLYGMTPDNTGWNSVFNIIPAGDANAWQALRDTVVSNIGLSKIMDLKSSSAQGATGLGALNEAELKMLQDHLGNLAQTQKPEEIQRILRRMDGDMQRIVNRKIRNLRQQRAWYNRNKTYLGIKAGSPDLILKEQEYLFSQDGYNKPVNESKLGDKVETDEERAARLVQELTQ